MMSKKRDQNKEAKKNLVFLAVSALGVVYGDIGTSPLYALKICFYGRHSVAVTQENILGVLSLIFWALMLVISIKYLFLILRADNHGEGGILALMELVLFGKRGRRRTFIILIGLFGAALLYGDGTITPAISVLSAIEGLEIATPFFKPYVVPITLVILFFLFFLQQRGTGKIGLLFGPIMLTWFLVIGTVGFLHTMRDPTVFAAINPSYGLRFILEHSFESLFIFGAVFLVVTGGEALYADIGHFGKSPIRFSWFTIVLFSLLFNYFGQGALLLKNSSLVSNPFYHLTPDWALYPMVLLATCATIIASQAVISGAFSLTFQALQLGYLPRLHVVHTSKEERGQIYIPHINWLLFVATAGVVLGFRSSSNLGGAYGVAVSATMVITTGLSYVAMTDLWNWRKLIAIPLASMFLLIDMSFLSANMLKILQGGWYPLVVAGIVYLIMSTWLMGQEVIGKQLKKEYVRPLREFVKNLDLRTVHKVSGTAIYLTKNPFSTPPAFLYMLKHNGIIHNRIIFLSIGFKRVPYVPAEKRINIQKLRDGFYRVLVRYGFMNRADIQAAIRALNNQSRLKIDMEDTTFFVWREILLPSKSVGMSKWRDILYLLMNRNSERISKYFNIPPDKVFEIGAQIKF
jgi:KUP system potassium uptake protein